MPSTLPKPGSLKIPRASVAHLLSQRNGVGTPRSSLDFGGAGVGSAPTPRTSLSDDMPNTPRSPRSPMSPGGTRRK